MIERDRELLARAARVNRGLGAVVCELMAEQDGGQLPATRLAEIGSLLSELAGAFRDRAAELDGPPVLLGGSGGHTARTPPPGRLAPGHWAVLEECLAEMCSGDAGEIVHDRGRGVLECCRAVDAGGPVDPGTDLRRRSYEVIGALVHLDEAAPDDRRAIRRVGVDVCELGRRMTADDPGNGGRA